MFSNASEASFWQENNCWLCWKYRRDDEGASDPKYCRTARYIDLGYIGILPEGRALTRLEKIIAKEDCPYLQEERPVYKKKHDSAMPLFEEVV